LEITILPCVNPYGFENNTRENYNKKDLNRFFKEPSPPIEIQLVKSVIKPSHFDLTLELHEDIDSHGYYLFQKSNMPNGLEYGTQIINSVKKIIPINFSLSLKNCI
jgi:predicted deacylase